MRRQVIFVLCAGFATLSTYADQSRPSFPSEQVAKGAELFSTNCQGCHGAHMLNPQLGIDLKTFPHDQHARFVNSVTHGLRQMPPWGDVLKPDDIEALWSYIVTGEPK